MFHLIKRLAPLLLAIAVAGPVAAAETLDATSADAILAIVKTFGDATADVTVDGDPLIIGRLGDKPFVVFFRGCVEHKDCKFVSFYARWENDKVTPVQLDQWNAQIQFARAFFETPGVEIAQMEVNMLGGITEANLTDTLDWFRLCLASFQTEVIDKAV